MQGPPDAVARDLTWLREQGIAALLSLTEAPLDAALLRQCGLDSLHLPVPDMTPPAPEQLRQALAFIDIHRAHARPVAVHCLMGQGRTGTVLAAYLIREGKSAGEALAMVRAVCPGAVENRMQEQALEAFATRRGWLVSF
jgi:atypical dual specificity phosphatase